MQIIHQWDELTSPPERTVLTIGNFDGVHLGHRSVFRNVVSRARTCNGTPAVYTFCPHPLKVLRPDKAPCLITTTAEKEYLIAASGISLMLCPPFTHESAAMRADAFVRDILVGRLALHHLVVGADYAFGRGREGDVAFLRKMGREFGFTVQAIEPVLEGAAACSSTRIRQSLCAGDVAGAVSMLGRHYSLAGTVIDGDKRGRELGYPTANLTTEKELLPATGVYAVKTLLDGRWYDGVTNVGCKPTYGGQATGVEVHLLDFSGDLYGQKLRLHFFERLREERTFASSEALTRAIRADVEKAKSVLNGREVIEFSEREAD